MDSIDGEETHAPRTVPDITGNPTAVIDARSNTIQEQRFDLLARPLFTGAADEGYERSAPLFTDVTADYTLAGPPECLREVTSDDALHALQTRSAPQEASADA